MTKYERLKNELATDGVGTMKCFGNSMKPVIESGTTLVFLAAKEYKKGDIVFCKVKGRYIDAHRIIATNEKRGYLIANNKGHQNGWTRKVFGKVVGTMDSTIREPKK